MRYTNKIVTAACVAALLARPSFDTAWMVGGAGGASVVAKTLKLFISDPRPSQTHHAIRNPTLNDKIHSKVDGSREDGMPSTHSTVAGWLFTTLFLLNDVPSHIRIPALAFLALIPLSRTRLGKHTRLQVWCGGALGVLLALVATVVKPTAYRIVSTVVQEHAPLLAVFL
ncbi:hypothetical protein E3P99_01582 [Wallemia hederae]|uniref:Phosphatidic acid phosphatase type 2/haloperoxidase domain-containing protein n=1 Tax=Wallemia hederae TaxID=1540922 RepID=A0A4T0FRZ0_9BASI|nr:hypothetical protein E3P99_01582 [Wallemia hederae]